jgi:hypothetical protein
MRRTTTNLTQNQQRAEEQIEERQKIADFDIREYPVEVIIEKYNKGKETDQRELFIPDYQREFVWDKRKQSRFIESILINLPIPYLFVADSDENEGRLEIIDGTQRIRTLDCFYNNELKLEGLEFLSALNGFYFQDLSITRQRRFLRKTLRMIEMTNKLDEEARHEIFDRLNSGVEPLTDMEQRTGSRSGPFLDFIIEMSQSTLFKELCPISEARRKRQEYPELVLRYFAYLDRYQNFDKSVREFLNDYLKSMNESGFDRTIYTEKFNTMLNFVHENLIYGFRKSENNTSVPRIRFEALSVGISLALANTPNLRCNPTSLNWVTDENSDKGRQFKELTRSDASNSRPKVIARIQFVRDNLL